LRIVWYVEEIDKELQIVLVKRGFLMMADLNIVRGVILNVKNVINLINVYNVLLIEYWILMDNVYVRILIWIGIIKDWNGVEIVFWVYLE
jgi:hypothetical protein